MATDQATTFASPLASSSAMTLLFCALITLVAAYTLILFVKNVLSSFRSAKSGAGQQARFLCQNCSILYGKRAAEGEADLSGPVGGNKLTDYNYPGGRQTGWPSSNEQYVKCSECSVRVLRQQAAFNGRDNSSGNSSRSNKSDSSRFYGANLHAQHQIIFGKSKDSILVPDWFGAEQKSGTAASAADNSNKNKRHQQQQQQQQQQSNFREFRREAGERQRSDTRLGHQHALDTNQQRADLSDQCNWCNSSALQQAEQLDQHQQFQQQHQPTSPGPFAAVTTRVLTDEKGHSIKVRIASPPPQRQSLLAKQIKQQQQHSEWLVRQQQKHEQHQQQADIEADQRRDSSAPDCPLISLTSISDTLQASFATLTSGGGGGGGVNEHRQDSNGGDTNGDCQQIANNQQARGNNSSILSANRNSFRCATSGQSGSGSGGGVGNCDTNGQSGTSLEQKRRHSELYTADCSGRQQMVKFDLKRRTSDVNEWGQGGGSSSDKYHESSEFETAARAEGAAAAAAVAVAPIEAFNDSNTSEFDDVPGCDSREDTSLDYMGSQLQHYQAAASKGAKGRAPAGQERASPDPESSGSAHSNSNEMVMDADLRQVNRLNLELALFQNAHTDHRPAGTAGHDLHHHAIGGFPGQQQQHHHHNHLPQSGILCAASEVGGPMATSGAQAARPVPVPVAAPRRAAKRQSSEDCDSGCQARDEPDDNGADDSSRRSSGIGTCGDRSISSASSTPTTVASSTALAASQLEGMASIRLEVRRLSGGDQSGASGRAAKKSATLGRDPSGSDNRDGAAPASGKRSLLYSLANTIGRSKSSESASSEQAASKADELGGSGDTRYEISLIEVRNIGGKQPGGPGGGAAPADTPPVERPRASSLRGRRDSLLNALMAAANNVGVGVGAGSGRGAHLTGGMSPNTQRRSPAIEGVFARVFKQQTGDAGSGSGAAGQQQPSASPGGDSSAISSGGGQRGARLSPSTSSASSGSQAAPDYIQLPLIKFDSGQQQHGLDSVNFELSAPNKSYRFTCRLSEFPVRLSLYQVSKRNGARYTLGHCIVTPADWQSVGADKQQDGAYDRHFWPANKFVHLPARLMGSSGTGTEFATISETNAHGSGESSADFGSQQERRRSSGQDKWALEYCLHRTILDAIKAS